MSLALKHVRFKPRREFLMEICLKKKKKWSLVNGLAYVIMLVTVMSGLFAHCLGTA